MRLAAVTVAALSGLLPATEGGSNLPGSAPRREPLVVFASGNSATQVTRTARVFERRSGQPVTLVFGGGFAAQVEFGAAADVVITDGPEPIARLMAAGRVLPGSDRAMGVDRLVLLADSSRGFRTLTDLGDLAVARVALVTEASAAGRAARRVLTQAGLWRALQSRLVYAEDGRQAVRFLEAGVVDAALVPAGSATPAGDLRAVVVDGVVHPTAAIIRDTPRLEAARAFVAALASAGR